MAVPDLETWQAGWRSADQQRLGVRPVTIAVNYAAVAVDLPYGDERDDDPLFATSVLTYVADVVALSAVRAYLDEEREQPNGTASLHLNFVAANEHRDDRGEGDRAERDRGDRRPRGAGGRWARGAVRTRDLLGAPEDARWSRMTTSIDWAASPFFQHFGLQLDEMQEGYVRLSIPRDAVRLRGARDAINGGLVAALGNVAMQVCLHTVMGRARTCRPYSRTDGLVPRWRPRRRYEHRGACAAEGSPTGRR